MDTSAISRRRAFRMTAASLAAASAGAFTPAHNSEGPQLRAFNYGDVKLTSGPLKRQFDRTHAFFLALDENRMLKIYRQRAGLPSPGEDMGGWYDADGYTPGATLGQYISGLARFANATSNPATVQKVHRLVKGFAATVSSDGCSFANAEAARRCPGYIVDKHAIGLLDAHRLAGTPDCLAVLKLVWGEAIRRLPKRAVELWDPEIGCTQDETYTLPENLYYANEITGDPWYRETAKRFLMDDRYFDPLARGEDALNGRHAYSHVNALSSGMRAYLVEGEAKYLRAVQNAFDLIEAQQYASGGCGPDEILIKPDFDTLFEKLQATPDHFETPCGAYAHLKLARYLLCATGRARYGDSLERVLYNTILGAKDIQEDGRAFYYADYRSSATKRYYHTAWPCCSGTYPQVIADYAISVYFHSREGVYVNLFVPSELRWNRPEGTVRISQWTEYPLVGSSVLTVQLADAATFTLFLRIPGWSHGRARISVNGADQALDAAPGGFAAVRPASSKARNAPRALGSFAAPTKSLPCTVSLSMDGQFLQVQ